MDDYFRIAHNDLQTAMEQLLNLRFADHSATIGSGESFILCIGIN